MSSFTFFGSRLGQWFLGLFLAISLLPLALMGWFAIREGQASIHQQTFAVLRAASDGAEAQVREFLRHLREETVSLSQDGAVRAVLQEPGDSGVMEPSGTLAQELVQRQRQLPDLKEIFVIGLNGQVVASSVRTNVGKQVADADYFRAGCHRFVPGDIVRDGQTQQLTWVMAAPIYDSPDGHVLGVLACRVDPQTLSALTTGQRVLREGADTQCFRIGKTGETYLVNRAGLMITESRFITNAVLNVRVDTLPVRVALNQGKEVTADYPDYRGIKVSGASMLLPDMGWVMVSEIDFTQALAPLTHLRNVLLVLTLVLCLLATFLAYRLADQILRPIKLLSSSDRALASGNESAAIIPEQGLPANELGELIRRRNARVRALFAHQRELLHEQQQRAEAVAELERMSYSIMHDMRAPLRAIIAFGEMIEQTERQQLALESRTYLERMKRAATRMDRLICDVLNYSRIVREELPLRPVNVLELLRGIIETYPNLQPLKSNIHLPPDCPLVLANEAALTQCFSNLLENALQFARPGIPAQIHVRTEPHDGWVRIWVEDNGIGVPKAAQERIFGIFVRGTHAHDGTGIGLAIVRKATERMGGRVGVVSEPESGSRFWLELRAGGIELSSRGAVEGLGLRQSLLESSLCHPDQNHN